MSHITAHAPVTASTMGAVDGRSTGEAGDVAPVSTLRLVRSDSEPAVLGYPATATALRRILLTDLRCRRRWLRHARRSGADQPNQAGVAWVLALELWDRGEVPESRRTLPRSLKDRTSRALSGRLVSASTLALFVDAFELPEEQEAELYAAWEADTQRSSSLPG